MNAISALLPDGIEPVPLLLAALVTFLSACVQGTLGFGFAVVSVPLLSLLHPSLVPVPQLLLALPLTLSMAYRERSAIDLGGMGFVLAGRVVGTGCGLAFIGLASPRVLDAVIGSLVLFGALVLSTKVELERTRASSTAFGALSGFSGYVSAMGGPPLALLYRNESGSLLRASLAAQFAIGLVLSISTRAVSGQMGTGDVVVALWLLPPLLLGVRASHALTGRIAPERLRNSVLSLSAFAGAMLLWRAWYR